MFTNLRWLFLLITFWPLSLITHFGWAQGISLPASGTYTETFDNLRAGLPAGWTVRRGASTNPPALGVSEPFATTPAAWSDAGASFKNVASADGLLQTATPTEQAASSDRALGVRQTPTFGDPGTAFTLQIAKTLGVSNIRLQFKIQSLDAAAARTTNWRVEYGLGESPAIYFQVGQSFTTGGNTRSNETINIDFGSKLNSNSGPIWIRIIANNASSGSGERPLTAIDDVVLTYQTSGFVLPASTNTISYAVGNGPATGDFSFQYYYPDTAPGSLTIISPNPSLFTISGDNVTFGSTVVVPYTTREPISVAIKVRLAAGLAAGAYSGDISVKGIGGSGDFLFFISGLVTQTTQPTFVTTISSLTGGNGFQNYVGFGPKVKFLTLLGANLTPVPGNYTITSSNPSAFRISTGFGTNGSNTVFYRSPNPPPQTIQVEFSGGLPAGEYTANLLIEGGGATPITVPLSGTVSVDDTPPVIRVTPTILPTFTTTRGIPSAPQTVTLTGTNFDSMAGQINITSPAGFEVALFGSSIYNPNPGVAPGAPGGNFALEIKVRMTGGDLGNYGGNLVFTNFGGGAAPVSVVVSGTVNPVGTSPLSVTALGYNCQTGAIQFGRLGGDANRAVEYEAIGVKSYSTNPNGVIEAEKRGDPNSGTTVTLKARYVGDPASEVTYTFDFGAYCRGTIPPNTADLKLIEPGYNCQTGAITFRTQGGDGTPIEYEAIGVKSYSTNPNGVIEAEKRGDPNSGTTVTLKARQSGKVVEYVFDFAAYCHTNGGRQAAAGRESTSLKVVVLGNPIGNELSVDISGIATNALQLRLTDVRGMIIEERNLMLTTDRIKQTFDVQHQQPGLLILQVMAGTEVKAVQVFKP